MSAPTLDVEAILALALANGLNLTAAEAEALRPRLQGLLAGVKALDDLPLDGELPAGLFDARWEDRT